MECEVATWFSFTKGRRVARRRGAECVPHSRAIPEQETLGNMETC